MLSPCGVSSSYNKVLLAQQSAQIQLAVTRAEECPQPPVSSNFYGSSHDGCWDTVHGRPYLAHECEDYSRRVVFIGYHHTGQGVRPHINMAPVV